MKELLKKKSVIISILLIILLVVMGIVGINVRSAQSRKEYSAHISTAEKYLFELDYEQAIVEYTKAFEIDPKEEVVDALEQTYLAYAQTFIDSGDYEKAISILEEGYEKIGRESVQNKIEEFQVMQKEMLAKEAEQQEQKRLEEEQKRIEEEQRASGMVEFPFQMTDITVMGYDLFGDYYAQMKELILADSVEKNEWVSGAGRTSDNWIYQTEGFINEAMFDQISMYSDEGLGDWCYSIHRESGAPWAELYMTYSYYEHVFDYPGINAPVKAGEIYEDWCRVMQIDQIKENNLRPEERDGIVGIWKDDVFVCGASWLAGENHECWRFSTERYQGIYSEYDIGDEFRGCAFFLSVPNGYGVGEEWSTTNIFAEIDTDGVIERIEYTGWPIAE